MNITTTLAGISVALIATAANAAIFSFTGEFTDGRGIHGELNLWTDSIEVFIESGEPGGHSEFFTSGFERLHEIADDPEIIIMEAFTEDFGGSLVLSGSEITSHVIHLPESDPFVLEATIVLWDTPAEFFGAGKVTDWSLAAPIPEPSPKQYALGSLIVLGLLISRRWLG